MMGCIVCGGRLARWNTTRIYGELVHQDGCEHQLQRHPERYGIDPPHI